MRGACIDTLVALVEQGPLEDGDVPSKSGRDDLIDQGLAQRVMVKGEDGFTAATYAGRDAYRNRYRGPDGEVPDTVSEAKANRLASGALRSAAAK